MKSYYVFFLKLCLIFVPLSVSVFGAKWHYLFLILSIFSWVISKLAQPFIYLSYYFKIYIFLFFTPMILSLAFGLPVGVFFNFNFFDYAIYFNEISGRLSNYILILFFCFIFSEIVFLVTPKCCSYYLNSRIKDRFGVNCVSEITQVHRNTKNADAKEQQTHGKSGVSPRVS